MFKCIGEYGFIFDIVDNNYVDINDKVNRIRSEFYEMIKSMLVVPIQKHYFFKLKLE